MNKSFFKWCTGTILAASMLCGQSCSDDHFTIDPEVAGRTTLWENISSQKNLSEFADILSRVHYSKSEGSTTSQTYADLLNHDQVFTLWVPQNGTFDYERWNALLNDKTQSSAYKVEKELIRNCMTRFSHLLMGGNATQLALFNSKTAVFDCGNATIKGQKIIQHNIGTSNGVLHVTDGAIEYQPNLYEYLSDGQGIDSLNAFIKENEELAFDEDASTQGPTIDGNITWVDSVTTIRNTYLTNEMRAHLNREDSLYAMIMPTNKAWDAAYEEIAKYYKYMPEYSQSVVTSIASDGTETKETRTKKFSDAELDSISGYNVKDVITRNLTFNVNEQYGHSYTDFSQEGKCDSLTNTVGKVFQDPQSARLFDKVEPVVLSNGYAYVVDNYNFSPEDTWAQEKVYNAYFCETYSRCIRPSVQRLNVKYTYYIKEQVMQDGVETTIVTPRDTVIRISVLKAPGANYTVNNTVTFALPNTLSCKYDVYAVMAYNNDEKRPYRLRATMTYHDGTSSKTKNEVLYTDPTTKARDFYTKEPYVDENNQFHYCDSVLLAKDFEFPVCYYGLSDYAYATLTLQSYRPSSERNLYTNELLIEKIVLVPKISEEE